MRQAVLTAIVILASFSHLLAAERVTVGISLSNDSPAQQDCLTRLTKLLSDEPPISVVPVKEDFVLGATPDTERLRAAGKRSSAALLVHLEVTRQGQLVGAAIYETRHGGLLADITLPRGVPAELATLLASAIRQAVVKNEAKDCRRIAIVQIDATGLPMAEEIPLTALLELFEQRLTSSPRVIVVPRGTASLDKVIAPDIDAPLRLRARAGENPSQVALELAEGDGRLQLAVDQLDGEIIDRLAGFVWMRLGIEPPKPVHATAARHSAIAADLWAQDEKAAAIRAAERAVLCDSRSLPARRRLSTWLLDEAESYAKRWRPDEQQRFAARAFRIERGLVDELSAKNKNSIARHVRYPDSVSRLHSMMNIAIRIAEQFPEQERARLRSDHFRCVTVPIQLYHRVAVRDAELVPAYSLALGHHMHYLCRIQPDTQTRPGQEAVKAAQQWLDLFDELPQQQKPWSRINVVLRSLTLTSQVRDLDKVAPLYERLEDHPHELVQLFGRRGRLTHAWSLVEADQENQVEQFRQLRTAAIETLDAARRHGQRAVVIETVQFLDDSFNTLKLPGRKQMVHEMLAVSEALLQRGMSPGRILIDACASVDKNSAKRAYKLLGQWKKLRGSLTGDAARQLARLESMLPDLPKAARKEIFEPTRLLDARDLAGQPLLLHPLVRDDRVYTIALSDLGDTAGLQLIRAELDGSGHELLGKLKLTERFGSSYEGEHLIVTAAVTEPNSYYAAVRGQGIVRFDLRSERVSTLVASDMLPKGSVQSLAMARGSLYVGMSGGKLLVVGMMTGDANTLAATDSKVITGPLDDRPPFDIPLLIHDEPRNRLLVFVLDQHREGRGGEVWQYDLPSRKLLRLQRFGRIQLGFSASLRRDDLMLADTWFVRWNLKTNQRTVVANYDLAELTPQRKLWIGRLSHPPVHCQDAYWWLTSEGAVGRFPFPDGDPELHFPATLRKDPAGSSGRSRAIRVDDRRLLLQHDRRLWLASPTTSQ